jgi:hypothetical protein
MDDATPMQIWHSKHNTDNHSANLTTDEIQVFSVAVPILICGHPSPVLAGVYDSFKRRIEAINSADSESNWDGSCEDSMKVIAKSLRDGG